MIINSLITEVFAWIGLVITILLFIGLLMRLWLEIKIPLDGGKHEHRR